MASAAAERSKRKIAGDRIFGRQRRGEIREIWYFPPFFLFLFAGKSGVSWTDFSPFFQRCVVGPCSNRSGRCEDGPMIRQRNWPGKKIRTYKFKLSQRINAGIRGVRSSNISRFLAHFLSPSATPQFPFSPFILCERRRMYEALFFVLLRPHFPHFSSSSPSLFGTNLALPSSPPSMPHMHQPPTIGRKGAPIYFPSIHGPSIFLIIKNRVPYMPVYESCPHTPKVFVIRPNEGAFGRRRRRHTSIWHTSRAEEEGN